MAEDYAPTGRLIEIDGRQVHAHQEGSGPDVILLHGAGGNTRDFTFDLLDRLSADFRVTAFDRPGLGHTDPLHPNGESPEEKEEVMEEERRRMGLGKEVMVGN
ncbi:alpha/beta fold hydrolase [Rhodovulum sulfidophilum]|uniref:alpha/beta fold hydrolase n=1 Tax=Rhodovulum sulfidophilum TaxID=35806 RepID=UPI001922FF9B|nr:alpha/beta hydrolase [Rhodovulum sulfidophilum]MBL3564724.1 alpha/beta fold hydrolase [Rhodovulum sulfidophilum]